MTTQTPATIPAPRPQKLRRAHPAITISAWTIPVLVLGQFALLSVVPVVIALVATLRDARSRALRWWVGALALVYAAPLLIWALKPDRAESLSKDISPIFVALIVAVATALLIKIYTRRKR
ncbi:hypothetical protein [Agromyces aureus]|uniref:hypothetical protein n=1 Tax=Agromyces aureus TaxID=453304 RepID=UPI000833B851|nr:hypothetical protein [Agromyces aureus]